MNGETPHDILEVEVRLRLNHSKLQRLPFKLFVWLPQEALVRRIVRVKVVV